MKRIAALVFVTAIVISACNSSDKKTDAAKDKYEQTKETLEETEKKKGFYCHKIILLTLCT